MSSQRKNRANKPTSNRPAKLTSRELYSRRVANSRQAIVSHLPVARLPKEDINEEVARKIAPFAHITTQMFRTKGFYDGGTFTQSNTANVFGSLVFSASLCANFTDLAQCFDMYRIVGASVSFSPSVTENINSTSYMPRLYTVIDYDDGAAPTSFNALQQYDTLVVSPPCRSQTRALCPRIAMAAYSGSFTSYANMEDQWIDINSPNVAHYGLKFGIEAGLAAQASLQTYRVDVELFLEFRATR